MRVRQLPGRHRKQHEARQDGRLLRVLESRQQKSASATVVMGTPPTPTALGTAFASAGHLVGKSEINFRQGNAVCSAAVACVYRKLRPFDLVTESLNVSDDGRAAMLLIDAASLAVQVETPT